MNHVDRYSFNCNIIIFLVIYGFTRWNFKLSKMVSRSMLYLLSVSDDILEGNLEKIADFT